LFTGIGSLGKKTCRQKSQGTGVLCNPSSPEEIQCFPALLYLPLFFGGTHCISHLKKQGNYLLLCMGGGGIYVFVVNYSVFAFLLSVSRLSVHVIVFCLSMAGSFFGFIASSVSLQNYDISPKVTIPRKVYF
jgi:hypothetical protein